MLVPPYPDLAISQGEEDEPQAHQPRGQEVQRAIPLPLDDDPPHQHGDQLAALEDHLSENQEFRLAALMDFLFKFERFPKSNFQRFLLKVCYLCWIVEIAQAGVGEAHGGHRGEGQEGVGLQGDLPFLLSHQHLYLEYKGA